jgi:hypothetical protein
MLGKGPALLTDTACLIRSPILRRAVLNSLSAVGYKSFFSKLPHPIEHGVTEKA